MNAIISLCHFCEHHGPRILFCTQAFHCQSHNPEDVLGGIRASPAACGSFFNWHARSRLPDIMQGDESEENPQHEQTSSTPNRQTTCDACRSFKPGEPSLISIDKDSHISYVSMQYPEQPDLYSITRHACVRSLSCEVCPGREGPLMFGDESSGYVISYTFFLKDSQSRGFQRWYSIICVMMDRIYLVNSWPFLVRNFKAIIGKLQSKTDAVYKLEQAERPEKQQVIAMSSKAFAPNQFRRARSGNQVYRSLDEITRDTNVFKFLHQSFSWVLRASGQRFTETVLEGPPLEDYLWEDGSDNDHSRKLNELFENCLNTREDTLESNSIGPEFKSLRHMSKIMGPEKFKMCAYHVVRGDQLIVKGSQLNTVVSVLKVLQELIPSGCCQCIPYIEDYQDSWRCNFLGIPDTAEVPAHVLKANLYVLVQIAAKNEVKEEVENNGEEISFDDYTVFVEGNDKITSMPSYLTQVLKALYDDDFTDEVFSSFLFNLKEQWMSKVKVLFKFSRTGSRTVEEKVKLLQILDANKESEILLKFWLTSLSRSYRSHLLGCSGQSTTSVDTTIEK